MKMPKGEYYIGDPCYIIPENEWQKFCGVIFNDLEEYKGKPVCVGGTAYGDGVYKDNYGNTYGVDAGVIGCIPKSLWDKKFKTAKGKKELDKLANFVKFDDDFNCEVGGGNFNFGDIEINTGDSDEEEECCCECGRCY